MNCSDLEKASPLYLYDELSNEERAAVEAHLAVCDGCRVRHEEAQRLHRLLVECPKPEAAPDLLVRCRQALDETLDHEQVGWRSLLRGWLWSFGAVPATRAVAVLTLITFGFGLGWTLRPHVSAVQDVTGNKASAPFEGADLGALHIRSINQVAPDLKSGGVRIQMDAERRVTLQGSLDDPRIRKVLVDTVKSYDNPGIRRDTLDALRMQTNDPAVREALMCALHDANAGVRLEALQMVQHMECGNDTHQGLLKVVEKDPNVGVRTAAIDALVQHMEEEGRDEVVLAAFQKLAAKDQNPVVRMRCLATVRKFEEEN